MSCRDIEHSLLNGAGNNVAPDCRGPGLPDAVDAGDGLQLEAGIDEGFAEKDVGGVDEGEAR